MKGLKLINQKLHDQKEAICCLYRRIQICLERSGEISNALTFLAIVLCRLWQCSYNSVYINTYFDFKLIPLPFNCVLQIFMSGNCFSRLLKNCQVLSKNIFNCDFSEALLVTEKLISRIRELILMMIAILMGEYF